MKGLQGGLLLVFLAVPFGAYVAWQLNGVTRGDLIASEPPADAGASKEQLAATRAKAEAAARETHKAAEVAWRFRPDGPGDAVKDKAAAEVVKGASARSADLHDLDKFLSGTEKPAFGGQLKDRFEKWHAERVAGRGDEEEAKKWLANLPDVNSVEDVRKVMDPVEGLVRQYTKSRFADRKLAAEWRLRARLHVVGELAKLADAQYPNATRATLPLEPGDNNAVAAALKTLGELKEQVRQLNEDLKRASDDKLRVDGALVAAVEATGAVSDKYAARERLLALFTRDPLTTSGEDVVKWLKEVADQHDAAKDAAVQGLIRKKVQEFCDAFIPETVLLDTNVILVGEPDPAPRDKVKLSYNDGGPAGKKVNTTLGESGYTEFDVEKLAKWNGELSYNGKAFEMNRLKPTAVSRAARLYTEERKRLADGTTALRWTAKSVEELKKKCEAQSQQVNQLQVAVRGNKKDRTLTPRIWARLGGLADGIRACPKLFDETQ